MTTLTPPPKIESRPQGSPLGEFLRARRDSLSPSDVGIMDGSRRRVTGLRRQEVARVAGISAEYYLRLEQGTDRQPSRQVLVALSRGLRLDADGTRYLFRLAGQLDVTPPPEDSPCLAADVLEQWSSTPAYVVDRHQFVIGINDLGVELLPFLATPGTNLLEQTVLASLDSAEDRNDYWNAAIQTQVAALRFWCDSFNPQLRLLVASLSAKSKTFRDAWARHEAHPARTGATLAEVPPFGFLPFRWQVLELPEQDQFLFAYSADSGAPESAAALDFLRAKIALRRAVAASSRL
ncbi:hypothetical protein AS850_16105 [Frondihabitans sp. 762G35]|uniref:MmyB family transcriptional regulator n=1 Tax=Frondihabitans sp. 762G35 TaxID=1446794 RepID=UPI000D218F56|nr:helix-turn-helix domain-containing protein [Frondihabitans sp. 762G35]ARC58613.1 hypothetical protein AS850_16105 [Frondihabitans sp. 762G35]